jgi:hypothetical protein
MANSLTHLEEKGFWTGEDGERLLLATQKAIRAEKVLLVGLGTEPDVDVDRVERRMAEIGTALRKLKVRDIGIRVPMTKRRETEYADDLEVAVHHLVRPMIEEHGEDPDFIFKVVFSMDTFFQGSLKPLADRLRTDYESILSLSLLIERDQRRQHMERDTGLS